MTSHIRLASTKTGVGVRTSAAIKKGRRIDIWEQGDMVYVRLESVNDLEYLRWLNVFGIVVWKGFYAPPSPIKMSLAWYINHSPRPNVTVTVSPSRWIIRARRDIRAGEELTVDYGTLDFNPALNRKAKRG